MITKYGFRRSVAILLLCVFLLCTLNMACISNASADATIDIWNGSVAKGFGGGNGTEKSPYLINTASQLAYLAKEVNAATDYTSKFFKLTKNLNLNKKNWTSIGRNSSFHAFKGTFDGGGYTVSNLYMKNILCYQGLFGAVSGGTVKNLGVVNCNVSTSYYVGGLVGEASKSQIINCYTTGKVDCAKPGGTDGLSCVGGIIGITYNSSVIDCYSTCTVTSIESFVGGLIGDCNQTKIINCYTNSNVSGYSVGGIVGYFGKTSTMENSYATGHVVSRGSFAGGLAGQSLGTITNCYATGSVSGLSDVGGLVGVSSGSKIITSYAAGFVKGTKNTGGIIGNAGRTTLKNCAYDANVTKQTKSVGVGKSNTGTVKRLSTVQMKNQSYYANWDFETVWDINATTNNGYPFLRKKKT